MPELDPTTVALFESVRQRWEDDAAHAALLEYCRTQKRLGDAARLYREAAREPGRGERSSKQLGLLLALAMSELERPPRSGATKNWLLWLTAALFLLLTASALALSFRD